MTPEHIRPVDNIRRRNFAERLIIAVCLLLAVVSAYAAEIPLKIAGAAKTKIGIYIEDLRNGEVLMDVNSDEAMVPASVTKSLTAATAYSMFSPRGRFSTPVTATGKIKKGVLDGDIVISTIGDPTVESSHFAENAGFADSIISALERLGIKEIKGTVVIDESNFVDSTIPDGWLREDIIECYGAGLYASNFRDNRMILSVPANTTRPHTPGIRVEYKGGKGAPRLSRHPNSNVFEVTGNTKRRSIHATVANPAPGSTMRAEVMREIEKAGIVVADKPRDGKKPSEKDIEKGEVIYVHHSPEVEEILRSLMFRSDNMMAEGMLRSLAAGKPRKEAVKTEKNFWLEKGFDISKLNIEDGSGLSRRDRMTPRFMAEVYKWMYHTDMAGGYVSLFPKAGRDGTMRNFMRDSALAGRLATKTGSMRGVQCYGGYMLDEAGNPTHVVVVFVNNFSCGRAGLKKEIGRVLSQVLLKDDNELDLPKQ